MCKILPRYARNSFIFIICIICSQKNTFVANFKYWATCLAKFFQKNPKNCSKKPNKSWKKKNHKIKSWKKKEEKSYLESTCFKMRRSWASYDIQKRSYDPLNFAIIGCVNWIIIGFWSVARVCNVRLYTGFDMDGHKCSLLKHGFNTSHLPLICFYIPKQVSEQF